MSLDSSRILLTLLLLGALACSSKQARTAQRPNNAAARAMAAQQMLPPCPPQQASGTAAAGLLQAPSGRVPLAGVGLSLISPVGGAPAASTTTDGCGRFQFAGATPGPYLLRYGGRNFTGTMPFAVGGSMLNGLPLPFGQATAGAFPVLTPPVPQLRAGVVRGAFDDFPSVLDKMGIPYALYGQEALAQPTTYQHPLLFIACDGFGNDYVNEAAPYLRNFVTMGGSLYATHNALPYLGQAFPGAISYDINNQGDVEVRQANIVDPGLVSALRGLGTVSLIYDTGGWGILNQNQPLTTLPLLRDTETQKPTAVRFMYGLGSVRFSSFHKEPQMSATQEAIIIYMISGM